MKLKLVVSLMSAVGVLSLVSSPALAATQTKKHHKHHAKKMVKVVHRVEYKDMGALPVQPVVCPRGGVNESILDSMRQSVGRAKATDDCNKAIQFSGGMNADFAWGNRSQGYNTENIQRISLNDAYLNVNGNVNEWAKAFASISFNNASGPNGKLNGRYSTAYETTNIPLLNSVSRGGLTLEQGYVTFGNFDVSPFFFDVGKEFTDYGRYEIHPIQRTLTQSLTESLETAARVGFITNGFHGSLYTFDNPLKRTGEGHTTNIYGAALGYDQVCEALGFDLGVGYMSNMTGVNDVYSSISNFQANNGVIGVNGTDTGGSYARTVGGIAVYADVNSGPFSIGARYATALQNFSVNDLPTTATANTGAKPWAADITAGYGFVAWDVRQNIYAGYQTGNHNQSLLLPKNRWMVGYGVEVCKNANLGLQFAHDTAYGAGTRLNSNNTGDDDRGGIGGTGTNSNTVNARIAVKFG